MITYELSGLVESFEPGELIELGTLVKRKHDDNTLGCVIDIDEENVGYETTLYYRIIWSVDLRT